MYCMFMNNKIRTGTFTFPWLSCCLQLPVIDMLVLFCSHFLISVLVAYYMHMYVLLMVPFDNLKDFMICHIHSAFSSGCTCQKCMSKLVSHVLPGNIREEKMVFRSPDRGLLPLSSPGSPEIRYIQLYNI